MPRIGVGIGAGLRRRRPPAGGGGYSAEVQQFFDRLLTPPDATRAALYATLIDALVAGGVWTKLDTLYVFAAVDEATSLANLLSSSYLAVLTSNAGAPSFTADRGWQVPSAFSLTNIDSTFNPSTAGGHYARNDAMFAGWQTGNTQENKLLVGPDSTSEVYPKWSDNHTYWDINSAGENGTVYAGNSDGFWMVERTGANACELFRNNVSLGTGVDASAALANSTIRSAPVLNKVSALVIGGSLTSGQKTTLYNYLATYMTAVGVP